MSRQPKRSNRVDSPCIRHCCLDLQDVCLGCFRTLEEILAWHQATDSERQAILERCRQRQVDRHQATAGLRVMRTRRK
ncbi:DUF1289 domain-containing protein [Shewanella algae]|uniref:DUF1289 domain-containing protein n=1 Tax=Shewanella algae TaxID=38313 RepID=UPI0009DFCCD5|nr:DUF1289 domain-containing protein [Shewanella algae]MBC8796341.1 DUF1289 domain-containing protein [Shewanella algae]MBO2662824.1 DUF1289 domain-containing protein [Shewanella algae]MCL1053603.1 DUF1289 domain-containing protein [Shewanella algae]NKZ40310.1 DUF1289 domain-containing protein [Shewanella algae]PWF90488.1 DUF1289 domain-containing protein [Shewanella algae]